LLSSKYHPPNIAVILGAVSVVASILSSESSDVIMLIGVCCDRSITYGASIDAETVSGVSTVAMQTTTIFSSCCNEYASPNPSGVMSATPIAKRNWVAVETPVGVVNSISISDSNAVAAEVPVGVVNAMLELAAMFGVNALPVPVPVTSSKEMAPPADARYATPVPSAVVRALLSAAVPANAREVPVGVTSNDPTSMAGVIAAEVPVGVEALIFTAGDNANEFDVPVGVTRVITNPLDVTVVITYAIPAPVGVIRGTPMSRTGVYDVPNPTAVASEAAASIVGA